LTLVLTDGSAQTFKLPEGASGAKGDPGQSGEDGAPGLRGEKGDPPSREEVEAVIQKFMPAMIEKAFETAMPSLIARTALVVPAGRDGVPGRPGTPGEDGKDGRDGFDVRDFNVEFSGRTLTLRMGTGEQTIERQIHIDGLPRYVGTFVSGKGHAHGDMTTYGGSVWLAKRDTDTSPPGEDWQLVVKGTR
jgi:hypothetical protein